MDLKLLETEVGMVLDLDPPEIQAPVTLSESQGTKILVSKIFCYHENKMLFYGILWFVGQNLKFYAKNKSFWAVLAITIENDNIGMFLA